MEVRTSFFQKRRVPRKIVASLRRAHNKGATVQELRSRIGAPFSTTRRRISEMMADGFITHAGIRVCKVTGHEVYTYRLATPVTSTLAL